MQLRCASVTSVAVGDSVFVPNELVGRTKERTAVSPFEIVEVGGESDGPNHRRSIRVKLRPDENADDGWVARSRIHQKIGITLVRVGDLATETDLLDPLAKSLGHFLRLLVGHDYFHMTYLRTVAEFKQLWAQQRSGTTHLVLVGHGRSDAIQFLPDAASKAADWVSGADFAKLLDAHGPLPKVNVLTLACMTGLADFARPVSKATAVGSCAGAIHDVHGAVASQFGQTIFAEHLLQGRTWPVAFRSAREGTPGTSTFRYWRNGKLLHGASAKK